MKIGILTFHQAHNYGAVLQCYALQEVLRKEGHDVSVINYQQKYILGQFKPQRLIGIRSCVRALLENRLGYYFYNGLIPYVKSKNFKDFRHRFLHETVKCYNTLDLPAFDLYIVGSDQPWNPDLTGGADLVYWGQFLRSKYSRLATYAMSGSLSAIGKVGWENVADYCKSFDFLSFREETLAEMISNLTGKVCPTVLDPTLLADVNLWKPLINEKWRKKKYVFLYHVGAPKNVLNAMYDITRHWADIYNCEIIDGSRYLYTPSDFVSLIKYAQFVVTASFHAMVFSVIFQKAFVVAKTGQASDARFENLLKALGIDALCLKEIDNNTMPVKPIYSEVQGRLTVMREKSVSYLKTITQQ